MAKREPYIINGKLFKTKDELREYIRNIRDSYLDGQRLNDEHFKFMFDLLQRHEEPQIKIGCGIAYMYIKTNEVFKHNREFWLARLDGTETDFSFEICLKHETQLQKFKNACRTAVAPFTTQFKLDFFAKISEATCPLTGEIMSLRHNSHVDHAFPNTFDKIVQEFIGQYQIDVANVELLTAEDGRVRNEIVDKELEQKFVKFHNEIAELRIVSKRGNLSIAKSGNLPMESSTRQPNKAINPTPQAGVNEQLVLPL
jgi:hypothetical protein